MVANKYKNGIIGLVVGDALGRPVEFVSRNDLSKNPVTKMRDGGTYGLPAGAWTDDSSMTIATLDSIVTLNSINPKDIMLRFCDWCEHGRYTPYGELFDIGATTRVAIYRFINTANDELCGSNDENSNGNGSLMRILPACLYAYDRWEAGEWDDEKAVRKVHEISGLTHNHLRAKIGCGLYYFLVKAILSADPETGLAERLQKGIDEGFAFYENRNGCRRELAFYDRLRDLNAFRTTPVTKIKSSGYVVDTLEAAVWALLNCEDFETTLLVTVNLGEDTDTVGAVCGGLAGLYYGYGGMPEEWIDTIVKIDKIKYLCETADTKF